MAVRRGARVAKETGQQVAPVGQVAHVRSLVLEPLVLRPPALEILVAQRLDMQRQALARPASVALALTELAAWPQQLELLEFGLRELELQG